MARRPFAPSRTLTVMVELYASTKMLPMQVHVGISAKIGDKVVLGSNFGPAQERAT
jgi:hypothetical protein